MINVPQAVWIDERGHIVRPTETAGVTDGFRKMDTTTYAMPKPELDESDDRARAAISMRFAIG